MLLNLYLNKIIQNSVHCLSCEAVTHTVYLNFCSGCMRKGLGLRVCDLGFGFLLGVEGPGLEG